MASKNTDRIMSIMATVVALSAVGIAVFEASIEREYQRLSVYPRLELGTNTYSPADPTANSKFQKFIRNAGLGPAIIHNFEVSIDGEPYFGWDDIIKELSGSPPSARSQRGIRDGIIVPAGEEFLILDASFTFEQNQIITSKSSHINVMTCYCSLYNECWKVTEPEQPKAVDSCVIDENRQWKNR